MNPVVLQQPRRHDQPLADAVPISASEIGVDTRIFFFKLQTVREEDSAFVKRLERAWHCLGRRHHLLVGSDMFGSRALKCSEHERPFLLLVAIAVMLLVGVSATAPADSTFAAPKIKGVTSSASWT